MRSRRAEPSSLFDENGSHPIFKTGSSELGCCAISDLRFQRGNCKHGWFGREKAHRLMPSQISHFRFQRGLILQKGAKGREEDWGISVSNEKRPEHEESGRPIFATKSSKITKGTFGSQISHFRGD
jgi:hypothetical protein